MNARCVAEFDTAVKRLFGYFAAAHSENEPQPQPRSSTACPSASSARSA